MQETTTRHSKKGERNSERASLGRPNPHVPEALLGGQEPLAGQGSSRPAQFPSAADSLAPGPPPGALGLTSSGQSRGAPGAVWMVLVNTLSCAQPGRVCGQREGAELAAPMAGQANGRADRRAALHNQAKAQNGAAAPVAMEMGTEQ
jgi:hypothetical protein